MREKIGIWMYFWVETLGIVLFACTVFLGVDGVL
jgi:hypothetical protein